MKRALMWIVVNGIFAAFLYFGYVEEVENARRVTDFMVWLLAIFSLALFSKEIAQKFKEKGRSVPAWIGGTFDITVIIALVWYGAIFTASAYTLHTILEFAAYSRDEEKQEARQ
jgi:hypothetical protein